MKKVFLSLICIALAGIAMAQNATLPQNITIKSLDGTSVQTSAIQNNGKPIILSFWATWCKPCNRELNTIKEVYEEWQEETGVKLVAISIDDARSAARVKPHVDGNDWQTRERVFGNPDLPMESVPLKTSLQRIVHDQILKGHRFREGEMFLPR